MKTLKESLKNALRLINEQKDDLGISPSGVSSLYGEVYVCDLLKDFSPQIGKKRVNKNADVYLTKVKENYNKIEVKWSNYQPWKGHVKWGWKIGKKQLKSKNKHANFFVFIASDENDFSKIKYVFSVRQNELKDIRLPRVGEGGSRQYYVSIYESKELKNKKKKLYEFEKKLNNKNWVERSNDIKLRELVEILKKNKG